MACIIFFTEFAENGSIYDYIHKDHKQPPMSQIILWATQVAKGMFMEVKAATNCDPLYQKCCKFVAMVFTTEHTLKRSDVGYVLKLTGQSIRPLCQHLCTCSCLFIKCMCDKQHLL